MAAVSKLNEASTSRTMTNAAPRSLSSLMCISSFLYGPDQMVTCAGVVGRLEFRPFFLLSVVIADAAATLGAPSLAVNCVSCGFFCHVLLTVRDNDTEVMAPLLSEYRVKGEAGPVAFWTNTSAALLFAAVSGVIDLV